MSLVDRTNEQIPLSLHMSEVLIVDVDSDSSFDPSSWVYISGDQGGQDFSINLTFEEAALLRDRLNLILGETP